MGGGGESEINVMRYSTRLTERQRTTTTQQQQQQQQQDDGNGNRTCDVRLGVELELSDSEFDAFVSQLQPILRALADSWARETACGILATFLPYGLWWASVLASY